MTLLDTPDGRDLVLTRSFRAPIEDVWASVTEPDRTERWFGRWSGDGRPGGTVTVTMGFEDGAPAMDMQVVACEPPRRLAIAASDDHGSWRLELELAERDGTTELRFTHHLDGDVDAAPVTAGWEYYLDLLVAARTGGPQPSFGDYWPPQG